MRQTIFERVFLEYIELWLSALGLVLIWAIPQLLTPTEGDRWRITAITAIAIGIIHGILFWIVRRRRQKIKAQTHALIEQENARLEERVSERTCQLRNLAAELAMAEQRERHRLAVVLHDQLQQLLFSIQMRVQSLVKNSSGKAVVPGIDTVNMLLGKAIASTRNLSLELSPPVLAGEGLDQALQWLTFHMSDLHQLDVRFEARAEDPDVDEAMRVLLFQVVRELLASAGGSSREEHVVVTLEDDPGHVKIYVEGVDLGLGRQPASGGSAAALERLRKRLYFVGGQVEEQSQPGQAPRITITAPKTTQPPANRKQDNGT
jgi:two-component system CheB/CheR fusion protein